MALLDTATMTHFAKWINHSVPERYQEDTVNRVLAFVSSLDSEDLTYHLEHNTWTEIDRLAS